jgi:hypothetical protein
MLQTCAKESKWKDTEKCEEIYSSGERVDYYICRQLPFPFATREFIVSNHFISDHNGHSVDLGFTIKGHDRLPDRNVRGEMCKEFFWNFLIDF